MTPDRAARLDAQFRELGCPYPADDHRAMLWLEGYQAACRAVKKVDV